MFLSFSTTDHNPWWVCWWPVVAKADWELILKRVCADTKFTRIRFAWYTTTTNVIRVTHPKQTKTRHGCTCLTAQTKGQYDNHHKMIWLFPNSSGKCRGSKGVTDDTQGSEGRQRGRRGHCRVQLLDQEFFPTWWPTDKQPTDPRAGLTSSVKDSTFIRFLQWHFPFL